MKNGGKNLDVLDGKTARATFKVLQVMQTALLYPSSHPADKCFLQYFWISGDGTRVTLCNEQALGSTLIMLMMLLQLLTYIVNCLVAKLHLCDHHLSY
jgi:hypothetical protein